MICYTVSSKYMKNKIYAFKDHLKESLKNPKFKKEWEKSELEYQLACQLIEKRLSKKMSQRTLAKKINSTQAVVSNIETMTSNPSLSLLKRIAKALDSKLLLQIK